MSAKFIVYWPTLTKERGPIEFEIFGDGHIDTISYDLTYDETMAALGGEKSDVLETYEYFSGEPAMTFLHMGLKFSQVLAIANAWASDFFERFSDKFEDVVFHASVEYPPLKVESMKALLGALSSVKYGQNLRDIEWIYSCRETMLRNSVRLESREGSFKYPIRRHMKAFEYFYSALGKLCYLLHVHGQSLDDICFSNFGYDTAFFISWKDIARGLWAASCALSSTGKWLVDEEHAHQIKIALQVLGMED